MLLSGCGFFKNKNDDYLKARELPPTVVPEGIDDSALGQVYPIPPVADEHTVKGEFETPRPFPVSVNVFEEVVKIQSVDGKRWILTNRPPSETWPRIRNILNNNGIAVAKADAAAGVIETAWLRFRDDESHKHRYRFVIEPGIQLNSTEIHLLHTRTGIDEDPPEQWPTASESNERENTMLESVAGLLAGDISSGSVSLLAQTIGGQPKVDILAPKVADPYILIKSDYVRSWASVASSLARGGFTTIDLDQTAGTFYVNYQPEDREKPGFFRRLFTDAEEKALEVNYLVLVTRGDEGIEVRIVHADRTSVDRDRALELLKVVRNNLV